MSTKKIVVFTTNGSGSGKTILTDALNWGELQKELSKNGVQYSGMKAVDGKSKVTFENGEAALPDGDMTLFLLPVKTKSGAKDAKDMSFSEIRAFIKDAIESNPDKAKTHFNEGKNYTNKSTDDLRLLVSTYKVDSKSSAKKDKPATETKAVSKAVATAKAPSKKEEKAPTKAVGKVVKSGSDDNGSGNVVKAVAKSKSADSSLEGKVNEIVHAIKALDVDSTLKNDAVSAVMKLSAPKEEIDNDLLAKQARELAKGFSDVRL